MQSKNEIYEIYEIYETNYMIFNSFLIDLFRIRKLDSLRIILSVLLKIILPTSREVFIDGKVDHTDI